MAYGLATEKSASGFEVGAGEFDFLNFDTEINPHGTYMSLGNCSAATHTWTINKISKFDSTRGTRLKAASAETQREAKLAVTMDEGDPIKYALAIYGQTAIKAIPAQEIVDQIFTVSPGNEIYILLPDGSTAAYNYENLRVQYIDSPSAKIEKPVVDTQGSVVLSTGTIKSSGNYLGVANAEYYVKIVTRNAVSGVITDAQFSWKKGLAGIYSTPEAITGTEQMLENGVKVIFTAAKAGQDFVAGDTWKIEATAAGAGLKLGRDYGMDSVDVKNGKVRFPVSSSIGFNTRIKVSCHVPEQYIPRIYAGVKRSVEGMLRFQYDPTHGRQKAVTYYHVVLSPTGDDSMIGEDWTGRQLEFEVLADRTKADPDNPESVFYRVDYPGGDTNGVLVKRG